MNNQAAQTMPFQPEIFRAIARSTSDTAKTNALLNAAREIERLTAALSQPAGVVDARPTLQCDDEGNGEYNYNMGWNDCRSAMLAAAPAASGGEDGLVAGIMAHFCNAIDNLNDMPVSDEWARKWTAKAEFLIGMGPDPGDQSLSDTPNQTPAASVSGGEDGPNWRYAAVSALEYLGDGDTENAIGMLKSAISMHVPQPPAAASVSERARVTQAMLDAGTSAMIEFRKSGGDWTDKPAHAAEVVIRAAIEQALTQQRGECVAEVFEDSTGCRFPRWAPTVRQLPAPGTKLYTTPQPSADAVRELVKRILNWQPLTSINKADRLYQILIAAGIPFESVTDELESLLSAASGHQQNAAQGGGENNG